MRCCRPRGLGGGGGFRGALHRGHQDLVDGQLGGFLVGLASSPPPSMEMKTPDVVARYQPATDDALRFQLEGDLLQARRDLHGAAGLEVLGGDQALGHELLTGQEVDGGDFPGQPSRVFSADFVTAAPGSCSLATKASGLPPKCRRG